MLVYIGPEKNLVRVTTRAITGNCAVGFNLVKWKIATDSLCRECNEDEETIEHLLCFEGQQLSTPEVRYLVGLEEAAELMSGEWQVLQEAGDA